eukprot:2589254-Prymnesium_polylepis.4
MHDGISICCPVRSADASGPRPAPVAPDSLCPWQGHVPRFRPRSEVTALYRGARSRPAGLRLCHTWG